MNCNKKTLYICPTPIGNLEDITLRCLRVLKGVDLIAAEDTRITQKLLNRYNIKTKLVSYHKFSKQKKVYQLIERLLNGSSIALVTDSGTPVISDPGSLLISEAIANNITVIPLPGPSAITCALSISGIDANSFIFLGFLPRKKTARQDLLKKIVKNELPIVFFESPNRLLSSLNDIYSVLGDVNITVTRELTKIHEQILSMKVTEILAYFQNVQPRGEFTIIIDKIIDSSKPLSDIDLENIILKKLKSGQSVSFITKEITELFNINKNKVYKLCLSLQNNLKS